MDETIGRTGSTWPDPAIWDRPPGDPSVLGAAEPLGPTRPLLAREVRLLADGYRRLTEGKLAGRSGSGPTRAEAGRAAATLLAEAAQGVECRDSAGEPHWRRVPHLHDFAVGDQIAVAGHDLCAALAGLGPEMLVWTRAGRQPADRTAARALEAARRLRLTL